MRIKKISLVSLFILISLFLFTNAYADNIADYNFRADAQQGKSGAMVTGNNSGSAGYSYKLEVPSGRNGFTPNLTLNYNNLNQNNDNIFGYGWDLSTGYIIRDSKEGINNLYSKNYFKINIYGDIKELVAVNLSDGTHGTYGATVEEYWKYTFNTDNSWTIYDKKGVKYTFGSAAATRQDNPGDSTQIYKWMLEEIRDTNDNYIKFEYYKDQGQIYPKKINYTGNGTTDGPITIAFEPFYTGPSIERTDKFSDYKAKFKVTTRYIADKIKIFISGEQSGNSVTEYYLSFTAGENSTRSVLQSVQRYGRNSSGILESLPETAFAYTDKPTSWTNNSVWHMPEDFINDFGRPDQGKRDTGIRLVDVNGDGLPDIIRCYQDGNGGWTKLVKLNNGSGWNSNDANWSNSLPNRAFIGYSMDTGVRLADINGDNLVDILYSEATQTREVYVNTGSGWSLNTNWVIPINFITYTSAYNQAGKDLGVRIFDVNGDGLADVVRSYSDGTNHTKEIYLNVGSNWSSTSDSTFANALPPKPFVMDGYYDYGTRIVDINSDGLVDILYGRSSDTKKVYLNNGAGWTEDANWYQPVSFATFPSSGNAYDAGYRLFDINGDGLIDIIYTHQEAGYVAKAVYLNKGNSFESNSNSTWANSLPNLAFTNGGNENPGTDTGVRSYDVNGDGLDDIIYSEQSQSRQTYLSDSYSADLLNSITESEGKTISYTYKPSTQYKDGSSNLENPSLPFVIHTLQQVVENDGLNHQYTTTYKYTGGDNYYSSSDIWNRRFTGFNLVQKTDPLGNIFKDYYHQGGGVDGSNQGEYSDHFSKIGRVYRSESYDSSSQKQHQTMNKWDRDDLGSSRNFVKLAQTIDYSYDSQSSHKDKAQTFSYDSYGNVSGEVNYGEVTGSDNGTFADTGSDKITTNTSWTSNTTKYIVGLPYQINKLDNGNNQIWDQKIYYDNLSLGSVDKGNQTKEERWLTGSTYVNTQKTYNSYGNITTDTNERNYSTSISYDSNYFYPTSITNAKNQTSNVSYSTVSGKILSQTDPNGFKTQYTYDSFGRLTKVEVPDFTTPSTLRTQTENIYTDSGMPRKVQTKKYLDATTYVDSYTYYDGFKRKVQTREQAETANQFKAIDFEYNDRGELAKEYLPYFSTGLSYTSANPSNPANSYTYDTLGRVTQIQNSVGTTTNAYLPWQVNTTDASSKVKKAYKDAFDRLIKVEEIDGSNTYITQYTYNQLGYLTNIADAGGNIRNFTYDTLSRRTQAEDLHGASDQTFGVWNYSYDNAGNLTSKTDAKNQTTNYTYDELSRILTEDYTGQSGTEVSYAYDTATDGIGYLANVVNANVTTAYTYNSHNKIKTETKTINSINYTTTFEYNLQDNQTKITYPDNAEITYEYNSGGQLERVLKKESGEGTPTNVIGNYDYAANSQPSKIDFSNSVTTDNAYDSTKLYRLTDKVTYKNIGGQGGFDPLMEEQYNPATPAYRVSELEYQRTQNAKYFLNSDNSVTAEFHIGNIHYKDNNEKWQDIDLDMVDDGDNYKNKAHKFDSWVPKKAQQPRKIGIAGQFVSYRPIDANNVDAVLEQEGDKITTAKYTDAWQSADLVYKNRWYGLKEEIVLKDASAPKIFSFQLHPTNINFELKDKQLIYKDNSGSVLWQTQKPFAIDANGKYKDVEISIRQNGANYFVDLSLDTAGLAYPITIDPTDTFYPNASPEVASVDGEARRDNTADNWNNKRTGTGVSYADDWPQSYAGGGVSLRSTNSATAWWTLSRSIFVFDTSSLDDSAVIDSATFSLYRAGVGYNDFNLNIDIVSSNPASNTALAANDYDYTKFGTTAYASINMSSFASGYNDFSLNQSGMNNINRTGPSKFGARNSADRSDSQPGLISNGKSEVYYYYADQSGASQDPKLTITYHPSNYVPTAPTSLQAEGSTNPSNITDSTPEFSSIYNDPDSFDYAKWYQIQVIEDGGSFVAPKWDSGKVEFSPLLAQGQRSPQISYGGSPLLLDGTKYYWRMKYWDDEGITGAEGPWSDGTDFFAMKDNRNKYQDFGYTYDAVGNITKITDDSGSHYEQRVKDFTYDNLHRLASTTVADSLNGNYSQSYTYDPIGNITNKSDIGNYSYSQTNKTNPHAVTTAGSTTYTYDNNGNITGDGTHTYTWDYNNRLESSTTGGTTYNYYYDHEGNRVKKVSGANTTTYINKYYEIYPDGKIKKYIYGGDDNIAIIETNGSTKTPYYVHKDHLGGSSVVTDSSGNKAELVDYYPYGSTRLDEKSGTFENNRKFTGKELDSETGLYYYGQRYYNPSIGRWVSEDPIFLYVSTKPDFKTEYAFDDMQSSLRQNQNSQQQNKKKEEKYLLNPQNLNSYSYTINNPLKYVDPSGEFYQLVIAPAIGFMGGIANQYAADVATNVQNGATGARMFATASSGNQYLFNGVQGSIVAGTLAVGGPLVAGVASTSTSMLKNFATEGNVGFRHALGEGILTTATAGVLGQFKVVGRLPNIGTNAFFFGKHTQNEIIKETTSVSAQYTAKVFSGIISTLKNK